MNVFISTLNGAPSGAFSTRQKAENLGATLLRQFPDADIGIQEFTVDELDTVVGNSSDVWTVTFPNVFQPRTSNIRRGSAYQGTLRPDSFSYNSITKQFRIVVWAANEQAAMTRARTARGAFVNRVGAANL